MPHSSLFLARCRTALQKPLVVVSAVVGLVVTSLAIIGLITGVQLAQQKQQLASQAAPTTTISLTTSDTTPSVGTVISVEVHANTGSNLVKALDIALDYDESKLQLTDVAKGDWLSQSQIAIKTINQAEGSAFIGLVIPPQANPAHVTGQGIAAVATFQILAPGETTIRLVPANTIAGAAQERQNAITSWSNLSLTIGENVVPPVTDFVAYSYQACFNTDSDGSSTYLIWSPVTHPQVTAIEISQRADFSQVFRKSTANAEVGPDQILITDGTNFRKDGADNGEILRFSPNTVYYLRLVAADNQRSGTITYQPTDCAGTGGTANKQCNESCGATSECATNLICSSGKCRRDGNTGDDKCVLPPDKGLQRSCNQYCANDGECASGLKCWWNQCRNPQDFTNATCKIPLRDGEIAGCSQYCANDGECPSNLKCWWNQCRLPANLENTSCQLPKPTAAKVKVTIQKGSDEVETIPTIKPATVTKTAPSPTSAQRTTVSAKIQLDSAATPRPTTSQTVNDFPDAVAEETNVPTNTPSSPLSWIPGILAVVFVALLAFIFGPQLLKAMRPPQAKSLDEMHRN